MSPTKKRTIIKREKKWTPLQIVCTIIAIVLWVIFEAMINRGRMDLITIFLPR